MNLRERGKDRRRRRITDAARAIILEDGVEGLAMRRLAERAEVSVATLYNLYDDKNDIIDAVFVDHLDALDQLLAQEPPEDPIAWSRAIVTRSMDMFIRDAALFRPLLAATAGRAARDQRADIAERSASMQETALRAAMDAELLRNDVDPAALGRQIFLNYVNALRMWALGDLDDAGLHAQTLYSLYTCLMAIATDETRPAFVAELRACEPLLLASWGNAPATHAAA